MPPKKVAIIGAGPAGISAAIFLERAGFDVQVFEKDRIGGLLNNAHKVENYPGFPDGISGPELIENFRNQLENWDVDITRVRVTGVTTTGEIHTIETDFGPHTAHAVILAAGTRAINIGLRGEGRLAGKLLFYEIVKVPYAVDGARVIIVGGGDCAFDYALNLAERGAKVNVLMRGNEPKCLPLLRERADLNENIWIRNNQRIRGFDDEDGKLVVGLGDPTHIGPAGGIDIYADFGLIAIGREPSPLAALSGDGIFLAGDIVDPHFRQAGIAIGSGLKAAMKAEKYLGNLLCEKNIKEV